MKITAKIAKANEEDRCFWSFEYFPPKTEAGVINLYDRMERMYTLGPEFIDVTWNAGGSSSDVTMQVCTTAQSVYGLETCMHLTCTNMPREKIDVALKDAKAAGIQNILALRGDPPRGELNWTKCETGFSYAGDLVKYIREQYGDYFCIGVAGYPEGHTENPDNDEDMKHLKAKCDAGADYIVTQLFYDVDIFLKWYAECRNVGITVPILPGLMPIQNFGGFKRMTSLCKTYVPQEIYNALEPIKEDDKAVKDYGVQLAVNMCNKMKENGIRGFHFYTLNLERSTRLILEGLKFIAPIEQVRPLPWNPFKLQNLQSLANGREKENVRPIFWKNRTRSYILRTEAWDDFPNGRWGDARSPAFGEIDGYGFNLKYPADECLMLWGHPKSPADVFALFEKYCKGDLTVLPWSDAPLFPESDVIRSNLANINAKGFLTINSQPAVDGARSSHPVYGWGPKNGFVYQKAYLEFFVSPTMLDQLVKRIGSYPYITYYAVNKQGDLSTNTQGDSPNAVTWGVFPGQEILQPTIVDAASFMAWKDEAFELWNKWALLYDDAHADSGAVIKEMCDTYFLVNVVNNDYKEGDIFEIFDDVPVDAATRNEGR
ncbi:methylenetetrahydrofolate reductase-domain-containing protein [Geranomyces variabilis]|nr:methylenetetrahydrofolate reductase-domain-containing protein [Geranomyces variabilis]